MATEIDLQNKKIELIQWLSTLEDVSIIEKLLSLRKQQNKDLWDSISEDEKKSIEQGIDDAKNGNLHPHSKARNIYGKWL